MLHELMLLLRVSCRQMKSRLGDAASGTILRRGGADTADVDGDHTHEAINGMQQYQLTFIDLALKRDALRFGHFALKSGRERPILL